MSLAVKTILRPKLLSRSYSQRRGGRPLNFTENFFKNPEEIPGDEYEQVIDPESAKPAPLNNPGAPARVLDLTGMSSAKKALFTVFNKIKMNGDILHALREPDSQALQVKGAKEVERQHIQFGARHQLTREVTLAKTLMTGEVHLDAEGNVLESSSGALVTCTFGVPATHQGNLDGIIDAAWSANGTDILAQGDALRDQADQENLPIPTEVICHPSMKTHLRANTDFQTWAANFSEGTDGILRGEVVEGFAGFNWHFWGGYYEDSTGTMKPFVPVDRVLFCPAFNDPGFHPVVGSTLVPRSTGIKSDWQQALNDTDEIFGEYSYAKLVDDPMALWLYMGNKYALHFDDPNMLWQADVLF